MSPQSDGLLAATKKASRIASRSKRLPCRPHCASVLHTRLCYTHVCVTHTSVSHTRLCYTPVCVTHTSVLHTRLCYTHVCVTHTSVSHTRLCYTPVCVTHTSVLHTRLCYTHVCVTHTSVLHTRLCSTHAVCASVACLGVSKIRFFITFFYYFHIHSNVTVGPFQHKPVVRGGEVGRRSGTEAVK